MLQIYPKLITDALATVRYPGTGKNLVEANMIEDDLRIDGMNVSFSIIFEKSTDPFMKSVVKAAEAAIHTYVDKDVNVTVKTKTIQAARPEPGKMLPQVKNVIAVSSGKGGVGKSTVAANLAVALAQAGYKVGLLDADIFGPSMPKMFHMENENIFAEMKDGRQVLIPAMKYGVKLLSIGFFVNPETATLWRGGMASNALKQLIADCDWANWTTLYSTRRRERATSTSPCCRTWPSLAPSSFPLRSKWHWPTHARALTCTATKR